MKSKHELIMNSNSQKGEYSLEIIQEVLIDIRDILRELVYRINNPLN